MEPITCYIGMGSNLESPRDQVLQAFDEMAEIGNTDLSARSSLYRSDPVGPAGQPDYINAVARLETRLAPHALLDALQAIEQAHQRRRIQHWGPRTLDLDLLLYGNETLNDDRLIVPHAWMREREFVLWPLAEIAPELTFPDGSSLAELLTFCPMGTLEKLPL